MSSKRSAFASAVIASLLMLGTSSALAAEKQALRMEVGKPLQEAQQLHQAKKYREALAKVGEAERVGSLTPYETSVVLRMRIAAAVGAGDYATALAANETLLASGQLSGDQRLQELESAVKLGYGAKNYPKAIEALSKYRAAGGRDQKVLDLLPDLLYVSQRYADATKELVAQINAQEQAGQKPAEARIQLLASCALKQNNETAYIAALEKMVAHYPKDSYWLDLIVRTSRKPGFSDRLSLDVYRLRLKTDTLRTAGDYMEAAQLALQAGFPGEADQYLRRGFEKKLLGQGPANEVDRHKRLRDRVTRDVSADQATLAQADKQAAAQAGGDALIQAGLNYIGYGQYDKGVPLIERGIAKGALKKPELAKLNLGYAQLLSGHHADARTSLSAVEGNDGSRDLARLWLLVLRGS